MIVQPGQERGPEDRIHIQRLGRRVSVVTPQSHSMAGAVAIMTGALPGTEVAPADRAAGEEISRPL